MSDSSRLLMYCQSAVRLGSSRGAAFQVYRDLSPAPCSRRVFADHWKVARAIEALFTEYSTIRPGLDEPEAGRPRR